MMHNKKDVMRIFFGIPVQEIMIEKFRNLIVTQAPRTLKEHRWTHPDHCHITVRFIGEVAAYRVPSIIEAVSSSIDTVSHFSVNIEKLDLFPPRQSRIIAAYLKQHYELHQLFFAIERALSVLNFPKENLPFQPHITLCRKRKRWGRFYLEPILLEKEMMVIEELILYQSQINEEGSVYLPLHRFKLK